MSLLNLVAIYSGFDFYPYKTLNLFGRLKTKKENSKHDGVSPSLRVFRSKHKRCFHAIFLYFSFAMLLLNYFVISFSYIPFILSLGSYLAALYDIISFPDSYLQNGKWNPSSHTPFSPSKMENLLSIVIFTRPFET